MHLDDAVAFQDDRYRSLAFWPVFVHKSKDVREDPVVGQQEK